MNKKRETGINFSRFLAWPEHNNYFLLRSRWLFTSMSFLNSNSKEIHCFHFAKVTVSERKREWRVRYCTLLGRADSQRLKHPKMARPKRVCWNKETRVLVSGLWWPQLKEPFSREHEPLTGSRVPCDTKILSGKPACLAPQAALEVLNSSLSLRWAVCFVLESI